MLSHDREPRLPAPAWPACSHWHDINLAYSQARKIEAEVKRRRGGWLKRLATALHVLRPDAFLPLLQEDAHYLLHERIPQMQAEYAAKRLKDRPV